MIFLQPGAELSNEARNGRTPIPPIPHSKFSIRPFPHSPPRPYTPFLHPFPEPTMDRPLRDRLATEIASIREAGTYKEERILASPQGPRIGVGGKEVLNFCANNYLGLSSHPDLIAAAHRALDERGYGMSSVR